MESSINFKHKFMCCSWMSGKVINSKWMRNNLILFVEEQTDLQVQHFRKILILNCSCNVHEYLKMNKI